MDRKYLDSELRKHRHHFHQYPESAFEENATADYIAEFLKRLNLEVHCGIGGTGVVASLKAGEGKKAIGLRADMDCINIQEKGCPEYASKINGKAHACGHDGHMASLMGAAMLLRDSMDFNGTVYFIFQPAEEPGTGALAMINDGLFTRFPMDEIYGFHNEPREPEGLISAAGGPFMSSEDDFMIKIKGKGGHASSPHNTKDPIVIASEIIIALQTIVSRNISPLEHAVISCTDIVTDGAMNVIPSNVVIKGDVRTYSPEVQDYIEKRMRDICTHICAMYGAECEFEYIRAFVPLINSPECAETVRKAAEILNRQGENAVVASAPVPGTGSEDFAHYLTYVKGCYFRIGGGKTENPEDVAPPHNPRFDYDDDILCLGAEMYAQIAKSILK